VPRRSRPRLLEVLLLSAALAAAPAVTSAPAKTAACANANAKPAKANLAKIRSAIRCLVNRERTKRGVKALKYNSALAKAAQRHSASMVRNHFFDHDGPDGTPQSRIRAAGYANGYIGENIAWGSGSYATPSSTIRNWMGSTGHRRNILDPRFANTGVGVVAHSPQGGAGATYTQTFGG
jgi:uncharacterized protein YkwD